MRRPSPRDLLHWLAFLLAWLLLPLFGIALYHNLTAHAPEYTPELSPKVLAFLTLYQTLGVGVAAWWVSKQNGYSFGNLGIGKPQRVLNPTTVLLAALLGILLQMVSAQALHVLPLEKSESLTTLLLSLQSSGIEKWLTIPSIAIAAPVCEELAFRGLFLYSLSQLSPLLRLFLSSLLFSLYHLDPIQGLLVFPVGLVFGWLRLTSHSLWPAIIAHASFNFWGILRLQFTSFESKTPILVVTLLVFSLLSLIVAFSINTSSKPALHR